MNNKQFDRKNTPAFTEPETGRRHVSLSTRVTEAACGPGFQNFLAPNPRTLERVAQAATGIVDARALRPLKSGSGWVKLAKALLAQLVKCYAREICASTDISDIVRRDPVFVRLCGGHFPDARDISRFRSENREVLHRCLIAALHFLSGQKISLGVLAKVSDAQLAEEASRRIIMAGFIDSMELNGAPSYESAGRISYMFANRNAELHQ